MGRFIFTLTGLAMLTMVLVLDAGRFGARPLFVAYIEATDTTQRLVSMSPDGEFRRVLYTAATDERWCGWRGGPDYHVLLVNAPSQPCSSAQIAPFVLRNLNTTRNMQAMPLDSYPAALTLDAQARFYIEGRDFYDADSGVRILQNLSGFDFIGHDYDPHSGAVAIVGGYQNETNLYVLRGTRLQQLTFFNTSTYIAMPPTFSSDGQRISFAANGTIYVYDLAQQSLLPITTTEVVPLGHLTWSADDAFLLFAGRFAGIATYTLDLTTGDVVRHGRESYFHNGHTWLDGTHFIFHSDDQLLHGDARNGTVYPITAAPPHANSGFPTPLYMPQQQLERRPLLWGAVGLLACGGLLWLRRVIFPRANRTSAA